MTEYISKDRVKDYIHAVNSVHGFTSYEDYTWLMDAIIDATAADIQPVKWISVNNRLPENGDMVMCYCKTTTGEGNVYMFGTYIKEHWWLKTDRLHATLEMPQMKVMYWLPLPKPPKEDGK